MWTSELFLFSRNLYSGSRLVVYKHQLVVSNDYCNVPHGPYHTRLPLHFWSEHHSLGNLNCSIQLMVHMHKYICIPLCLCMHYWYLYIYDHTIILELQLSHTHTHSSSPPMYSCINLCFVFSLCAGLQRKWRQRGKPAR